MIPDFNDFLDFSAVSLCCYVVVFWSTSKPLDVSKRCSKELAVQDRNSIGDILRYPDVKRCRDLREIDLSGLSSMADLLPIR